LKRRGLAPDQQVPADGAAVLQVEVAGVLHGDVAVDRGVGEDAVLAGRDDDVVVGAGEERLRAVTRQVRCVVPGGKRPGREGQRGGNAHRDGGRTKTATH